MGITDDYERLVRANKPLVVEIRNMRVKLPKHMAKTAAGVKLQANNQKCYRTALPMCMYGDANQKDYARAWMALAMPHLKPCASEPTNA